MSNLFGDEYIGTFDQSTQESGPVTCLGMTFANDSERREYFRNELRNKLPELKHIEGFPIGEDEDIINLSDPPYYTACPNPWLNDFIAEWEEEKIELEKQGKRSADFQVTEPYASDVSEGRSNPIYLAHTYHTKVPHPAIMRYILHYTQPGDIVFDGFAGTGMTGVAANKCSTKEAITSPNKMYGKRHAICSDLSPIASFIAYNYNYFHDPLEFKNKAINLINEVEKALGWMYETKHCDGRIGKINYVVWSDVYVCSSCNAEFSFFDVAVDMENQKILDSFKCPHCGSFHTKKTVTNSVESYYDNFLEKSMIRRKTVPAFIKYQTADNKYHRKKPDEFDIELLEKIDNLTIDKWVPTEEIPIGVNTEQPRKAHITHFHHMYTTRNLCIAAFIKEKTKDNPLLNVLLTSYLNARGTKMTRYKLEKAGNAILNGTMYIASVTAEQNLFEGFRGKVDDFFKAYDKTANNIVTILSATSLNISSNSIDYIFTDPPFGGNIMYSELNLINEAWLKVKTNTKKEAIINKIQGKTLFDYQNLMHRSFSEFYRVLKPGKWITIEFSNTSASVWNSIQTSLQSVGFVVVNVAGLDKKQGSFKAITTTTAVKQDLVITCYKPSDELINKFNTSEDVALNVWDFIEELLLHLPVHLKKDNNTTAVVERSPKILFDRLISYYVQRGYPVPMNAKEFQKGLRDRFIERDGMYFTAEQSLEYEQKRAETVSFEASQSMFVGSEAEGIEWLKRQLDTPMAYQDLQPEWMQALVTPRKGDQLPELLQILEENFLKDEDGRWYKPNPEKEADLEKLRITHLLKLFNRYVEEASKPKGKIKEARLEALRCGFKDCYRNKDFKTIVTVAQRLPESLVMEDEVLLQYYDIAINRV